MQTYYVKVYIDQFLKLTSTFLAFYVCLFALESLALTRSLFSPTTILLGLAAVKMHATTALSVGLLYLVHFFMFKTFLPGHERAVKSTLFTFIGVYFYDFIWSTACIVINGYGSNLAPLTSTLVTAYFIYIYNNKRRIVRIRPKLFMSMLVLWAVSLYFFISSNFFQTWSLYEKGLAETDPHNLEWLINKQITLWMWTTCAER